MALYGSNNMIIPILITAGLIFYASKSKAQKKSNREIVNISPGTIIKSKYSGIVKLGNEQNLAIHYKDQTIYYGGIIPMVPDGTQVKAGEPIAKVISNKLLIVTTTANYSG